MIQYTDRHRLYRGYVLLYHHILIQFLDTNKRPAVLVANLTLHIAWPRETLLFFPLNFLFYERIKKSRKRVARS